MSHAWHCTIECVGQLDATDQANGLATHAALLAAHHQTATAEDDAIWNALIAVVNGAIATLDPTGTASVVVGFQCSGAHPGMMSVGCGFSLNVNREGDPEALGHSWQTSTVVRLTAPEITLARSLMAAVMTSQGQTVTSQDTACFDALVVAGQALLAVIDPSATGTITVSMSGVVSTNGVSLNLNVNSNQPQAPVVDATTVRKLTASTSNVTALADVAELGVSLDANTTYRFEYEIVFRTPALTTGIGLAVNGPAAPGLISYMVATPVAADAPAAMFFGVGTAYNDTVLSTAVPATNTDYLARIEGVIRTTAAGVLIPRFRSEVAGSLVTVQPGSNGVVRRMP